MNKKERILNIVDVELLHEMVNEVNGWDGSLEYLEFILMDDFNELMHYMDPLEIAYKIHYGNFDPNDDYYNFDAYANLISYSQWEIEVELNNNEDEIVMRFIELYESVKVNTWSDEIKNILDSEE